MSFFEVPLVVLTGVGLAPWSQVAGPCLIWAQSRLGWTTSGCSSDTTPTASHQLAMILQSQDAYKRSDIVPLIWSILQEHVLSGRRRRQQQQQQQQQRRAGEPMNREKETFACSPWPLLVVAVLLHHVRRTLAASSSTSASVSSGFGSWGRYVMPDGTEDWRLVLSRPDVFLEDMLTGAPGGHGTPFWQRLVASAVRKRIFDLVAGAGGALLLEATKEGRDKENDTEENASSLSQPTRRLLHDAAAVVFLLWLFSCIEYAVARLLNASVLFYAVYAAVQAAMSPSAVQTPLLDSLFCVVQNSPLSAALLAWSQLLAYPVLGLLPLAWRAVRATVTPGRLASDRPHDRCQRRQSGLFVALLALAGGQHMLLRYRARLYLAIETSGLFVVLGYGVLACVLVWADARSMRREEAKHSESSDDRDAGKKEVDR